MKLENAMFLWMPVDPEIYHDDLKQGRLIVVERGQNNSDFPMAAGACDIDWNEARTDSERFELLQSYVSTMIWEDGLNESAILESLSIIDDINPLQLDFESKPRRHD